VRIAGPYTIRIVRSLAIAAILGCGSGVVAPESPPPIVGRTGPLEMLAGDGAVVAVGAPLPLGSAFRWTIDRPSAPLRGDARPGAAGAIERSAFVYAVDGDLARGTRITLEPTGSGALAAAMTIATRDDRGPVDAPLRVHVAGDEVRIQLAALRRGTLPLPLGAMAFVLLGDGGRYDRDDEFVAFDLDRDHAIDFIHLDSAELFHVFEHAVTLDGVPYAMDIAPDGDALTLHLLDHPLPPRPALRVGTPAPDARVHAASGALALASLRGTVVLLDFWSPTCAPCVASRPALRALRDRLHPRGFEVVAISDTAGSGDDAAVGIDATDVDADAVYRIDRYPSYFLVDRAGAIACARCTLAKLEPMIEPLLATASPSPPSSLPSR
jgi:hypothetical protein